ncbi:MAG: AMP-binding protein [Hyphomicrobiaceae bacterium]
MNLLDSAETSTLPKLVMRNSRMFGAEPAMREKNRGIWQTLSWREAADYLRDLALGLSSLGFGRGDKLSVVGDNRPALYLAQLSAQALGGVAIPVYQDAIASELVYVLNHAEVSMIVAEDQEQVDKILSLRDQLPNLKWIIFEDPRGLAGSDEPILKSLEDVLALGRASTARTEFERELAAGSADDIAMIAYTSGTTGQPKGALLSHRNMIATAENYIRGETVERGDNWLAFLPMAWVGDAMYSLAVALVAGATVNCPESPETVQRDLRELGPTIVLAPPRIWETLLTQVQVRAADSSAFKRRVFEYFRGVAERRELLLQDGKPVPGGLKLAYALGEWLVYRPVRDLLGFRLARWAVTGGAPLGPDTFRFFRSFGINLKQVYGQTEASALVAFQRDGQVDPNGVGEPVPGLEFRIADNGELQVRGPGVFVGYYKQDDVTAETKTPDGWLKTGDAAVISPQGQLSIIDRAKDVGRLADGTPFAPQFIENKLKFSPFIREAVAFGDGRDFVAAMVAIDMETVGNWAERNGLAYTSFMDLARKPEVARLICEEAMKINATLPEATRVNRVLLLNKELDADDNEITRTRKVRRSYVAEKYKPVIDAFYGGKDSAEVTMEITFEDGRKTTLDATIAIHDVPADAAARAAA